MDPSSMRLYVPYRIYFDFFSKLFYFDFSQISVSHAHYQYFLLCRYLLHLSSPSQRPWWRLATPTPHRASRPWAHRSTPAPPHSPRTLTHTATHTEATCHTTAIMAITAATTATRLAHHHPPPHPEDGRHSSSSQSKCRGGNHVWAKWCSLCFELLSQFL